MFRRDHLVGLVFLLVALVGAAAVATAADLPPMPVKSAPAPDAPFFLVNDNRVTFSYYFTSRDAGVFSVRPDGSLNSNTAKSVYSFTHFDVWAYGTNFFNIGLYKSDHNDPASPCTNAGTIFGAPANCAGVAEIYGLIRSTFGLNEILNTKAFSYGPLRNVSLEVGAEANTKNSFLAPAKAGFVAGLQFAFDLPYKGYLNVAPLYYKEINHNAFNQCGLFGPGIAGVDCLASGNSNYDGTWAIETNYYMDLGFLPESVQFFSVSGRAAWYGKKGPESSPLTGIAGGTPTTVEFNSEPIRLTFDASKAVWGPKYSHQVDLWVAYEYWKNKFGLDASKSAVCNIAPGVSNNTCTEQSLHSGITVKF